MDAAAMDADPMLRLLTDALRRGPGSPEWHRCVNDLKEHGGPEADEYRLLITARERLESGRAYRDVRAGPAFTRELFGKLNAVPATDRRVPLGQVVWLCSLMTLVVAVGILVMWLAQARSGVSDPLTGRLFVTPAQAWTFSRGLPGDLRPIEPLTVDVRANGLHASRAATNDRPAGQLVSDTPLDLRRGSCVELRLDARPGPAVARVEVGDVVPQGATRAPTRTLALECDGRTVQADLRPFGREVEPAHVVRAIGPGPHVLRLRFANDSAAVDVDGQVLWSGPHGLGDKGYVSLALYRVANEKGPADLAVESLRVLTP